MRKVTLIPGDGIGPEISKSVMDIFKAAGVGVEFEIENAGEKVYSEIGELIPESLYNFMVALSISLALFLTLLGTQSCFLARSIIIPLIRLEI